MKKLLLSMAFVLLAGVTIAQTVVTTINTEKLYTLECRSDALHNTARFIGDNGTVIDGQSAQAAFIKFETAEGGYYIKIGEKYLNHDGTTISASETKSTVWILGTIGNLVTFKLAGTTRYLNNNGTDGDGSSVTNLKANNHGDSGPNTGNACSTWEMVEYPNIVTTINTEKVYTLECKSSVAHNTTRFIGVTDNGVIDGHSSTAAFIKFETAEGGYYIKIGEKYLNHDGTTISASETKSTVWILGTIGNLVTFKLTGTTRYLNNNGTDGDGSSVTNLKANNHGDSGPNTSNACSTWEMVEYPPVKTIFTSLVAEVQAKLALITIGEAVGEYSSTYENYEAEYTAIISYSQDIPATATDADIEAKMATLNDIVDSFTPNMPVDGKTYTFKNVQKDGSVCWFKYDTENDNIGLTVAEEEATKFACTKLENGKYTFTFDNGKYLIWRGSSEGNNNVKGYMDEYDETWAQLTIEKMTTGDAISGDLSATRYVTINGRRHNNGDDSNSFNYIVIKKAGPAFDQANAPFYNDNFSSAFIMDEVEPVPTAIENVEVENAEQVIYDLTGRRVETITEPGIYIVGGKKILVK